MPPDSDMGCEFKLAVSVPTPGEVEGPLGSTQVYVAAPDILSPLGSTPGRLLLKVTLLMGADGLLFARVI